MLITIIVISCIVLIISLSLIGASVHTMEAYEYGLVYNKNEEKIQTGELLKGGRYWLGLGKEILKFPRFQRALIFGEWYFTKTEDEPVGQPILGARTKEGLLIYAQVAIHFRLGLGTDDDTIISELVYIHQNFEEGYGDFLASSSETAIKNVFSRHSFEDFYKMRAKVEDEIIQELTPVFRFHHFSLKTALIMNIGFPSKLEDAIQSTENAKQEVEKYNRLKTREEVLGTTKTSLAQKTKEIMSAEADSIKNATTIQKAGELKAVAYVWFSYYEILKELANIVGAGSVKTYGLQYFWLKMLERHGDKRYFQTDIPKGLIP